MVKSSSDRHFIRLFCPCYEKYEKNCFNAVILNHGYNTKIDYTKFTKSPCRILQYSISNSESSPKTITEFLLRLKNDFKGGFLVRNNRVLNKPLGLLLCSFARTPHSTHSLRSASLHYARFARLLHTGACSLTSLTPSWDSWISWICVHAVIAFHGKERVFHLH